MSLFPHKHTEDEKDDPRRVVRVELLRDLRPEESPVAGRRINVRGFIILGVLAAVIAVGFFPFLWHQEGRIKASAIAEARALADKGAVDQALVRLNRYLEDWPEDLAAIELAADLYTRSARSLDQILRAASLQDQLIRLDPMKPERQENRKQLTLLYIRYGEGLRSAATRNDAASEKFGSRFRAAVKIASQRIAFGAEDADAHRLLGQALEGLSTTGDAKALSDATIEYEKAIRIDPGDVGSAERLAAIHLDKRGDQNGAEEILDDLLKTKPDSVAVRLIRYRFFTKTLRPEKATAELKEASRVAPTDPVVRLAFAGDALRRGDPAEARRNLDAIPEAGHSDKRVMVLRGQIDLYEQHPQEALDAWRRELVSSGGGDRELTWQMAQTLIRLGRLAEARPLVLRFQQLAGDPNDPMSRMLGGMMKERTGHPIAAIADLEEARDNVGEAWRGDLEIILGRCYEAISDETRAIGAYRRAIAVAPWSTTARMAIARIIGKDSPEQAAEEIGRTLDRNPTDAAVLAELAVIRMRQQLALPADQRNWKAAEEVLDRAPQDDPTIAKVRAQLLALSDRGPEALELLERATSGFAKHREDLWIARASLLSTSGRADEALTVLEAARAPEVLGDHAGTRIALAGLLVRSGRARAARDRLTRDVEHLTADERAALARTLAELLHDLGDRKGSRAACREWAQFAPDDPQPGLFLLAKAQAGGGEESARLGLRLLESVGGQDEPYALAARAFDLMLSTRAREETRSARLEMAEQLVQRLLATAPLMPVSYLVRGMILERTQRIEEAIGAYKMALRGNTRAMAIYRLVNLFVRQKRPADLDSLKEQAAEAPEIDRYSAQVAYEMGDVDRAQQIVGQLVQARPDSLEMRALQVRLLRDLGKPREAEELLKGLTRRDPDQAGSWLALIAFQVASGNREAAGSTVAAAAEKYQGDRPAIFQARCRWIAGDLAGADGAIARALRDGRDGETIRLAVDFFEATGMIDRAEALLREALADDPSSTWAAGRLALLLSTRGRASGWAEAWTLVRPGASSAGDGPEDRLIRATVLERSPDPARRAEAATTLEALIEDVPATRAVGLEARSRLGRAALDGNRPAEAAAVLAPVLDDVTVKDPAALALLIEALARSGQADEAAKPLARLLAVEPKSLRTLAAQAWTFKARGKSADASALVSDALSEAEAASRGKTSAAPYISLLVKIGQVDAARSLAGRVASTKPEEAWLLAGLLADKGQFADALEACRSAAAAGASAEPLRLAVNVAASHRQDARIVDRAGLVADLVLPRSPDDPAILAMAAPIRHFQGRFDDEVAIHRRRGELAPTDSAPLNDLAWVLSECLGKPEEALGLVDRAVELAGTSPNIADTRGVILARLGRFDEAIRELESAIHARPTASYHFHLAWAAFKAGRPDVHARGRDQSRKLGISPAQLEVGMRPDFDAVMAP